MILEQRIQNYVERSFLKSRMTEWPSVRKVARGLGIGMGLLFETVEYDHRCDTQGWNVEPLDFKELEIYTDTDRIETAWAKYWGHWGNEEKSVSMPTVRR